jgi:hypothetical protein
VLAATFVPPPMPGTSALKAEHPAKILIESATRIVAVFTAL